MMRRNIFLSIFVMLAMTFLASCSFNTDTVDGDGHLEGFWHLERVEHLATGSDGALVTVSAEDMSHKLVFWSFQQKLLELSDKSDANTIMLCRFSVSDGKLTIGEVYNVSTGTDSLTDDVVPLEPYGITSAGEAFTYTIQGNKMTLTGNDRRLYLKRF